MTVPKEVRKNSAAEAGARLREDGHFVARGLIPAEDVRLVSQEISEIYAAHGWLSAGTIPEEFLPNARRRDGAPGWFRFAEDIQRIEAFHRLAHHPALRALMAGVVGAGLLNHPRRHLTTVNPEFWVPPHQEYTYIQGTVDFFTAFVPFTPFCSGTGVLRVLNEKGARGVRPLHILPTRGVAVVTDADDSEWTEIEVVPGDVVIMHSLCTREITENRGAGIGLAAQYRFQSRRLPVVKASLKPEHYPRLPDWQIITKGWKSRRWIAPPFLPRLVPYRLPVELESWHEILPHPDSAYVATAGAP